MHNSRLFNHYHYIYYRYIIEKTVVHASVCALSTSSGYLQAYVAACSNIVYKARVTTRMYFLKFNGSTNNCIIVRDHVHVYMPNRYIN